MRAARSPVLTRPLEAAAEAVPEAATVEHPALEEEHLAVAGVVAEADMAEAQTASALAQKMAMAMRRPRS